MHTPSLADLRGASRSQVNYWLAAGELMLASAHKLAKMGFDFLICPDNTIHQALPPRHAEVAPAPGCTSPEVAS